MKIQRLKTILLYSCIIIITCYALAFNAVNSFGRKVESDYTDKEVREVRVPYSWGEPVSIGAGKHGYIGILFESGHFIYIDLRSAYDRAYIIVRVDGE